MMESVLGTRQRRKPERRTIVPRSRDFESEKENHESATNDNSDHFLTRGVMFKNWIKRQLALVDWERWALMGLIGFTVGFSGFLLHRIIDMIMCYKWQMANKLIKEKGYGRAWLWVEKFSFIFGLLSSSILVFLRPSTAGSCIPELNGTIGRHIFNAKTMAIQFFSCVCALVSGLPIGPEGPVIYLGGLIGLSHLERNPPYFSRFRNPEDRRNFISAGVGAGVASAFGAPVGGLLFAMEKISSSWDIKLSGQIFFCTMVTTLTTGLFNSAFRGYNDAEDFGLFKPRRYILFQIGHKVSLHFYVFIPVVILGVLGAFLGRIFTLINLKINTFRSLCLAKIQSEMIKNIVRICEICVLVIIVNAVSVFLPSAFSCPEYKCFFEEFQSSTCSVGCPNVFRSGDKAIRHLFSTDTYGRFAYGPLLTTLVVYFILACWTAGTATPSSLVIPMLFIGGAYGRIIGKIIVDIFGVHTEDEWAWMNPGAFALIGAASFSGGMPGITMSLASIMIEITNDTGCLLPILVTMMVAKYVGDFFVHPMLQAKDPVSSPAEKKDDDIKDSTNTDECEGKDISKRISSDSSGCSETMGSSPFRSIDPMKLRFLREHCWTEIKEKENICKEECVTVSNVDKNSFEIKGTNAGRHEMIMFLRGLAANVDYEAFPLNERGMKKQMSMDETDSIISDVEKNHKCVIEKVIPAEERGKMIVADGGNAAGTGGAFAMKLPYHCMTFVNDKEVKLDSGQRIRIVVGDLTQETVDVIVNTTNDNVDLNASSCGRALLKTAGQELANECNKIGNLQAGNIASTGPAKLNCKRVYHVRSSPWNNGKGELILRLLIRKCLEQMENDKLRSIAIPAIGTGNLCFPCGEVSKIFFEEVTRYLIGHPLSLIDDIRFVMFFGDLVAVKAFLDAVQEIKSKSKYSRQNPASDFPNFAKPLAGDAGMSIKIYCNDRVRIETAWKEFKRMINANIQGLDMPIGDDVIKKITGRDREKIRKLERDFDVEIRVNQRKDNLRIKGHIADILYTHDQIRKLLKDIKDRENKVPTVPVYWDTTSDDHRFYKFKLNVDSDEYKKVETAFHTTARNEIVSIERIQNKEIYKLYNVKREGMMKKHGSNFTSKEKMLFHGTSFQNLEKINAGGLNRSYAGTHAKKFGSGVYFARDAVYSCNQTYSPPDISGFRYMYYARVLVGDYTTGDKDMLARPSKKSAGPNETYDSVVNNMNNPSIYVLFKDYEFYTEYLITFT